MDGIVNVNHDRTGAVIAAVTAALAADGCSDADREDVCGGSMVSMEMK